MTDLDDWLDIVALLTAISQDDDEAVDALLCAGDTRGMALIHARWLANDLEHFHGGSGAIDAIRAYTFAHIDEFDWDNGES